MTALSADRATARKPGRCALVGVIFAVSMTTIDATIVALSALTLDTG